MVPADALPEPGSNTYVHNWMANPIPLLGGEALNFEAAEDNAGAVEEITMTHEGLVRKK
ncbi:MAG: hypothetical protein IIB17_12380 [Chloroflexi bacterium]|nr:hypothetical protein [Chloroflexota bacterium]